MQAVDQTEKVPAGKQKHILYLAGTFVGGIPVLARARMKLEPTGAWSFPTIYDTFSRIGQY